MQGLKNIFLFTLAAVICLSSFALAEITDPYQILNRQYDAVGGLEKVKAQTTSYIEADIELVGTGLQGKIKSWSQIPIMQRAEADLTIFQQTSGDNGEFSWMVDMNGKLQINRDSVSLVRRELSLLAAEYEFLNPESKYYTVSYEGLESIDSIECYTIKTTNTLNDDYSIQYIDASTFLTYKTKSYTPSGESHSVNTDYRDVNGVLMPFKTETTNYPTKMVQIIQITKAEANIEIDPALFQPPGEDVKDFKFVNGRDAIDIHFEYIENHIYLPMEVGGVTRLWVLDSGAGMTVITKKFANELGLEIEGNIKGKGVGNLVDVSFTNLPEFSLPGLNFNSQKVAVIEISNLFHKWLGLDVAGIIGYDFLSRLVVKVDYANELLSFYNPDEFEYRGFGKVIDAPLSGNMFHVPLTVDGEYGGKWNLDLGAGGMSFHHPFAKKHGFLDKKGVKKLGGGAGGTVESQVLMFDEIEFGGYKLQNIPISMPLEEGEGAFASSELSGNAGNTVFEHFILYLDYKREQVIIEKGDYFGKLFPRDNSGLNVLNTADNELEVEYISENSPAEKAGFMAGDIIISVNGINAEFLGGIRAVNKMLEAEPDTKYTIVVDRDGKEEKLKIKLADLFRTK